MIFDYDRLNCKEVNWFTLIKQTPLEVAGLQHLTMDQMAFYQQIHPGKITC